MHGIRKNATSILAFAILAAVSDVIIFHRPAALKLLRANIAAPIPHGVFEVAIAILAGLALLSLLAILRSVARSIANLIWYLWAAPPYVEGLEPKDRLTLESEVRSNQIQVVTTVVQALGGIAVLAGIYFAWAI